MCVYMWVVKNETPSVVFNMESDEVQNEFGADDTDGVHTDGMDHDVMDYESGRYMYMVKPNGYNRIKVGYWNGTKRGLWFRYLTPYGNDMIMKTYETEFPNILEQLFKLTFSEYCICNELFDATEEAKYEDFIKRYAGSREAVASALERALAGEKKQHKKYMGNLKAEGNLIKRAPAFEFCMKRAPMSCRSHYICDMCHILKLKNSLDIECVFNDTELELFKEYIEANSSMLKLFGVRMQAQEAMRKNNVLTVIKALLKDWNGGTVTKVLAPVQRKRGGHRVRVGYNCRLYFVDKLSYNELVYILCDA